jgi:predicted metal-dependent peptidase
VRDRFDLRQPLPGTVEVADNPGTLLDNHDIWQECLQEPDASQKVLTELLQEAMAEAGGMPRELLDAVQAVGLAPRVGVYILQADHCGHLNWTRLLRYYAGRVLEARPVYHRPPRRYPDLMGILPGRQIQRRGAVVAIIDTSSSITDERLEEIDGELARLSRVRPVHVVECDCEVRRVYRYRGQLDQVHGRGGTDLRPPLEPAFLRPLRPEMIIYFTDGDGPAPQWAPACPLIWCLVPGGKPPAPWGRVIRMDPEQAN